MSQSSPDDDAQAASKIHYRKALEATVSDGDFSGDAVRARVARAAQHEQAAAVGQHVSPTTPGSHESGAPKNRNFQPDLATSGLRLLGANADGQRRYEVGEVLGRGGSAQVFAARDLNLERNIAIKVLYPDVASDRARVQRFINEARVTAKLEHPYILPVYDLEMGADGNAYFSMRVAHGMSLGDAIRRAIDGDTPLQIATIKDRIDVFLKVLDAVSFAHDKGVIHQDIKPDNIMLGEYGEVMVVDWGTAIVRAGSSKPTGRLIGTPAYMAPEQARREGADERSDVYALGATFFQMLTLRHPSWESDPDAFWKKKREGVIDPPTETERAKIPAPLLEIALKALSAERDARYPSVKAFKAAIHEYEQHGESIHLQESARAALESAVSQQDYAQFNRAIYGFQEALKLWPENLAARRGLSDARLRHSACALDKGDLELALSTLDPADEAHRAMRDKIAAARSARELYRRRVRRIQGAAAALTLLCAGLAGYYIYDYFRYFGHWTVVYQQDFTREHPDLHGLYFCGATWDSEAPPPTPTASGVSLPAGTLLWLRDIRLHGDVRLEARVRWTTVIDGLDVHLNASRAQESTPWTQPGGYMAQFGGFNNMLNFIAAMDHSRFPNRANAVSFPFNKDQVYTIAFQREGEVLSMWIDGVKIHQDIQGLPLSQSGFDSIGLRSWAGGVEVLSLTASRKSIPEKANPLVAGDALYAEGDHAAALRVYRDLADDFAGSPIGDQALARAYLATFQIAELKDAASVRAEISAAQSARSPQSPYLVRMREADCLDAWKAGRYPEVFGLMAEIFLRDPDTRMPLKLIEEEPKELPADIAATLLNWIAKTRRIAYLDLDGLGIRDLTPLSSMKLARIDCANNAIPSLDPLRGMPLRWLNCESNKIKDLEPLRGAPLNVLQCRENLITSLEPLRGMDLFYLRIANNSISDLEPLRGMKLKHLEANANRLSSLSPLAGMPLNSLDCTSNRIADLGPLAGMPLTRLVADWNQISSLQELRGCKLELLTISNNPLSSLQGLNGLPLTRLDISDTQVADLEPLRGSPLLTIDAKNCPIKTLDPLRHSKLQSLTFSRSQVTDLEPLRGLPMTLLGISWTGVSNLEPLRGMVLKQLYMDGTRVSDLSPLTAVPESRLDVRGAPVRNLGLLAQRPALLTLADFDKWSDTEFESLLAQWEKAGADPRTLRMARAERFVELKKFDHLKSVAAEFEGHHYLYYPVEMTWEAASALAASAGAHLLTITSAREQNFALTQFAFGSFFWLGIEDGPTGERWVTGEPFSFRAEPLADRQRPGPRVLSTMGQYTAWLIVDYYKTHSVFLEWDN